MPRCTTRASCLRTASHLRVREKWQRTLSGERLSFPHAQCAWALLVTSSLAAPAQRLQPNAPTLPLPSKVNDHTHPRRVIHNSAYNNYLDQFIAFRDGRDPSFRRHFPCHKVAGQVSSPFTPRPVGRSPPHRTHSSPRDGTSEACRPQNTTPLTSAQGLSRKSV